MPLMVIYHILSDKYPCEIEIVNHTSKMSSEIKRLIYRCVRVNIKAKQRFTI